MSASSVSRPEFDLYMRMTAESNKQTSEAITAIQKQGQETLTVLKEYTIHQNTKFDKTNERIIDLAKKQNKLAEAVNANTKVTQIAKPIKWAFALILTGALIAYGTHLTNDYFSKAHKEEKVKP